jgi:hypothetical protein
MSSDYLFPQRLTRRDFLAAAAGTAAVGMAGLSNAVSAATTKDTPATIGSGKYTYTFDEKWGKLPAGMHYGAGCAVVIDSKGRVYVTSRSESPCVAIFDKNGDLLETWTKEFTHDVGYEKPEQVMQTAHGLYWSKEGNEEFLYWTENVFATPDKPNDKIGARVYKTDLKGKVLYTLGPHEKETSTTQQMDFVSPTDVAVAPNGDIYIVDGYGSQLVHRYDKNFKKLKTIGGPGDPHGKFNICHGVWISGLRKEPEVYIADRANNRIEVYSLELDYKRTIPDFRMPCCFYEHDGMMYVPELQSRLSIIAPDDSVVARLGARLDVPPAEIDKHPDSFATPHAMAVSADGDIYVVEWAGAQPRRYNHTPTA